MDKLIRCGEVFASCQRNSYSSTRSRVLFVINVALLVISASFTLLFIGWWKAMEENDRLNLLEFAFKATGIWLEWTEIFLGLSAATFVYLALFLLLVVFLIHARVMRGESASIKIHFAYLIFHSVIVLFCLGFVAAFVVLFSAGVSLLKLKIIFSTPILHFVLIAVLTVWVGFVLQRFMVSFVYKSAAIRGGKVQVLHYCFLGLSLALLMISYVLPFVLVGNPNWMPCIKAKDSMPPKPHLLGHRGAVALAPENTNMSFIATTSHGGFGLESDLQISKDHQFFMMHDKKLKRTTNVATVFPDRANEPLNKFRADELVTLNAGEWYVEMDPEGTVHKADPSELEEMRIQRIPSFREYLSIAKKHDQVVLWDFKQRINNTILQQALDEIDEVGIDPKKVWLKASLTWFPSFNDAFDHYYTTDSYTKNNKSFTWTLFDEDPQVNDREFYLKWNITNRNVNYGSVFPTEIPLAFAEKNITNNVWVVNSRWMFSLIWCTGAATSVTTNRVDMLNPMEWPIGTMSPEKYINFAGLTVGLSLLVLLLWITFTVCWLNMKRTDRFYDLQMENL